MAHYEDLSEYSYCGGAFHVTGTVNIGSLGASTDFEQMQPDEDLLDLVWSFCKVPVAQSRGFHDCEFCVPRHTTVAERQGEMLRLGTAQIRVFSLTGAICAAPDLPYHYMSAHRYRPPDQFILAMTIGPQRPKTIWNA